MARRPDARAIAGAAARLNRQVAPDLGLHRLSTRIAPIRLLQTV
ncbi:hypothetical protein [Sphingomonas psychrolutea]|nr:hypothetical protein [Sphingomonas psychrolutea]